MLTFKLSSKFNRQNIYRLHSTRFTTFQYTKVIEDQFKRNFNLNSKSFFRNNTKMATRSKGKQTKSDQNKITATQKHYDNRVFLLDGKLN